MLALRSAASIASMHSQLRILKEHHEACIHVVLLVAVEERRPGIVGDELYLHLGTCIHQDGVFQDTVDLRMAR